MRERPLLPSPTSDGARRRRPAPRAPAPSRHSLAAGTPSRRRRWLAGLALAAAVACAPAPARAQITEEPAPPFPDPGKYARGFFAEGDAGTALLVGKAGGHLSPGFAVGARVGYDVTRWLAAQAYVASSTHRGRFPGMPEDAELLQIYQAGGELRLSYRFRQLGLVAAGGAGYLQQSTNLLVVAGLADARGSLSAGGGAGLDWHTLSRHFSLGLFGSYAYLASISGTGLVSAQAYLRYTF